MNVRSPVLPENLIERIISQDELMQSYPDLAELAVIFNHEVIKSYDGTFMWKPNYLMCLIKNNRFYRRK